MLGLFLLTDFLAGAGETFLSVAIIGGLFAGGSALIKAIFGKNENKALEYQHQEKIIELMSKQNSSNEKLIETVEGLRGDVSGLRTELGSISDRVLKLEEQNLNK